MAGYSPVRENLILTRDADFVHIYRRHQSDPEFPPGTTAEIVITRNNRSDSEVLATWPAENVSEDDVSFWVQVADTNPIPDRASWRLLVHYPPMSADAELQDFCWFRGSVKREQ